MAHVASNGSIKVVVLSQDKASTKYVAIRNNKVQIVNVATATFMEKYPETDANARNTKNVALELQNPPKGLTIENSAIVALKEITTKLTPETTMAKPTAPATKTTKTEAKVTPVAKPKASTPVAAPKGKSTPVAAEAKAPKAQKAEATKEAKVYEVDAKKIVSVVANPKREGTESHARFALYTSAKCKTVADALAAGLTRADIKWDTDRGFIVLG